VNIAEQHVDDAIRKYWDEGGEDLKKARDALNLALANPPTAPKVLARALQVARRAQAPGYAKPIEEKLAGPMQRTRLLLGLIDVLGDSAADIDAAVFDCLAGWVPAETLEGIELPPLAQARLGAIARPQAARKLLDALGWETLDEPLSRELKAILDALEESTRNSASILVVAPGQGEGFAIAVNVLQGEKQGITALDVTDLAMDKQGRTVLSRFEAEHPAIKWSLEWPLRYAGESLGLGLHVAALVSFDGLRPDPLLAATGTVAEDGTVKPVDEIEAKLIAARDAGFRRVLLPRGNEPDAQAADVGEDLQLLFVERVEEIVARLSEVSVKNELSFEGRVRQARAALPRFGLSLAMEKTTQNSRQLAVTDASGRAILDVWSTGKVTASGPAGATKDRVQEFIAEMFVGEPADEREPHSFMLQEGWRQDRLRDDLEREGAQRRDANGTGELWRFAMRRKSSQAQLTLWSSGKGRLTGSAPAYDEILALVGGAQEGLANVQAAPKPKTRGPKGSSSPAELPKQGSWIGTDESGKGDYFGPLVSAAVFADEDVAEQLRSIGVQDSKQLTDKRVRAMAHQVREVVGKGRYKVTPLNPPRYNQLYREFKAEGKNLNSLLAWGHTRSIEDLLGNGLRPRYAIVDQFADARYIMQRLMTEARQSGLEVFQFPKAEADFAVAAASILAREAFLDWLTRTSAKLGITLPKGASQQVEEAAKQIAGTGGREALSQVAKLHFKTTEKVLGA
jgi:ribonuclease HIII